MNIELLRKVQAEMLKRPTQINMANWFSKYTPLDDAVGGCGTAGCIAGLAITLGKKFPTIKEAHNFMSNNWELSAENEGRKLLELDEEQSQKLFYRSNWPASFSQRYYHAKTPQELAQAVVDRIEHFIETDGKE